MKTFRLNPIARAVSISGLLWAVTANVQGLVINETLSGTKTTYDWKALNGACLTARTSSAQGASTIPGCRESTFMYYRNLRNSLVGGNTGNFPNTADPDGKGALRLTNGGSGANNQKGAIVSNFGFPSNEGINLTFTTVSYGGNNPGSGGGDGISFMLLDYDKTKGSPIDASILGAPGGSLAYSCNNKNSSSDGASNAYLGIGIDEAGNFINKWDNTSTGQYSIGRYEDLEGEWQSYPSLIAVRGAGNVNQKGLGTISYTTVQAACKSGTYNRRSILNYKLLAYQRLNKTDPDRKIANQQSEWSPTRKDAIPITYQLILTNEGKLTVNYSYNKGATETLIDKLDISANNGPMPANFRFGFAAATGGDTNVHEITCFKATSLDASSSSGATNTGQLKPIQGGTQAYFASYHDRGAWGQVVARGLSEDASGKVVISDQANWDANCKLTGTPLWAAIGNNAVPSGTCEATGAALSAAPSFDTGRNLITWNGTAGAAFRWATTIADGTALAALKAGNAAADKLLNFLRGDRTNETTLYRARIGVLGEVRNASPTWVGKPSQPYSATWRDKLNPTSAMPELAASATTYKQYTTDKATRPHVVYAGSNDGFVHAFRAGALKADGTWDTSAINDGQELFAYMPSSALALIHGNDNNQNKSTATVSPTRDYTAKGYFHSYGVDATPSSNDLFYNGTWHTWLVGGLGAGGNYGGALTNNNTDNNALASDKGAGGAIYALDITDPGQFSTEAKAAGIVLFDKNAKTLVCDAANNMPTVSPATVPLAAKDCGQNLGNTYGTPVIRRLHDGNWAVLFGNGLNSKSGTAGIYVIHVNSSTGALTYRYLGTNVGTAASKNGITQVTAADFDEDMVTDYVYAGDVKGNVWRFDLTDSDPNKWGVVSTPIYQTGGKPITTGVAVSNYQGVDKIWRAMVFFGTGQQFPKNFDGQTITYASGNQSLYGIWDWNLKAWKDKAGATAYPFLESLPAGASLKSQTLTESTNTYLGFKTRTASKDPVCWIGSKQCGADAESNNHYGWVIDLTAATGSSGEQIVFDPVTNEGALVLNTVIPGSTGILSCEDEPISGYFMALSFDGNAPAKSFIDNTDGGLVGLALGGVGTPFFVRNSKGQVSAVTQTAINKPQAIQLYLGQTLSGQRLSWVQLK